MKAMKYFDVKDRDMNFLQMAKRFLEECLGKGVERLSGFVRWVGDFSCPLRSY